jgi:hypothetical protein
MRSMLVYQGLRGIPKEQLRDDEKADVFFAVEGLLKDVTPITIGSKLNNAAPLYEAFKNW